MYRSDTIQNSYNQSQRNDVMEEETRKEDLTYDPDRQTPLDKIQFNERICDVSGMFVDRNSSGWW